MFWELLITACTGVCAPVSPVTGNVSFWHESRHTRALEPAISFAADTVKTTVKKTAAKRQPSARQNQKYGQNASRVLDMHIQEPQNLLQTTEMWAKLKKDQFFGVFWRGPPILQNIGLLQSFCRTSCAFGTEGLQALAGVSPAFPDRREGLLSEAFVFFAKQKASTAGGQQFSPGHSPSKGKASVLAPSMPLSRAGSSAAESLGSSISIKSSLFAVIQRLRGSRLPLGKQVHSLSFAGIAPQTV